MNLEMVRGSLWAAGVGGQKINEIEGKVLKNPCTL